MPFEKEVSMLCYVLPAALEPDVRLYRSRRCERRDDGLVWRNAAAEGTVTVSFRDPDRAALFLNLFDGEIERAYEAPDTVQAA
jgi:hypothetical protein